MQTFLPYPDFDRSAQVLDSQRLGKQRVEAMQLLKVLSQGPYRYDSEQKRQVKTPWYNHPAAQMWRGYEFALFAYGKSICDEWTSRGYKDSCLLKMWAIIMDNTSGVIGSTLKLPPWLGNFHFHASHRANLFRKNPTHYGQFGWHEDPAMPYFWPTKEGFEPKTYIFETATEIIL